VPELADRLAAAGFLAAHEEAEELGTAAGGDDRLLAALAERRLAGEPLLWIVGSAAFAGLCVRVDVGVYVPRPHTEALALRAVEPLPADGTAVDLCTGSGAVVAVLADRRPGATILATDVDERAVACARANGVDAHAGDLLGPLPIALHGRVDVVTAVVPYVPTQELASLQRDTFTFESPLATTAGRTARPSCGARSRAPRACCARAVPSCSSWAANRRRAWRRGDAGPRRPGPSLESPGM
jgi:release factor glutamine methyltransferase